MIAVAALVIFGALLRAADPIFASWVDIPFDVGTIVSHLDRRGILRVDRRRLGPRGHHRESDVTAVDRSAPDSARRGGHHRRARHARRSLRRVRRVADRLALRRRETPPGENGSHRRGLRATGLLPNGLGRHARRPRPRGHASGVGTGKGAGATSHAAVDPGHRAARRDHRLGDAADEDVRALLRPHDGPFLPGRLHALARDRHRVARVHRASRLGTAVRRRRRALGDGVSRRAERRRPRRDRRARQRVARRARDAGNGARARPAASRVTERTGRRHRRGRRGACRCAGFLRLDAEFSGGAPMSCREDAAQPMEPGLARSAGIPADGSVALLESRRRRRLPRRRCTDRRSRTISRTRGARSPTRTSGSCRTSARRRSPSGAGAPSPPAGRPSTAR